MRYGNNLLLLERLHSGGLLVVAVIIAVPITSFITMLWVLHNLLMMCFLTPTSCTATAWCSSVQVWMVVAGSPAVPQA